MQSELLRPKHVVVGMEVRSKKEFREAKLKFLRVVRILRPILETESAILATNLTTLELENGELLEVGDNELVEVIK